MTHSRPKSFWDEAAARAQGDSVRQAWVEEQATDQQPARKSLRRDAPPLPPALVPTDDQLRQRLAEELEYARRLFDIMGDELCGDPAIVVRHASALQAVDIVGQMLGHIANVVRCSEPEAAVERIGMSELKARLMRRSAL